MRAIAERDALPPAPMGHERGIHADALYPTWQFVGPTNYNGPGNWMSGRINQVAYHSQLPSTIWYAGADGGGVWKTVDSGAHWTPMLDQWPTLVISSLAVAQNDGDTLYAGGPYISGIIKSSDGGGTWHAMGPTPLPGDGEAIRILVDPDNANHLLTMSWGHIYQSHDAGTTWAATLPADAYGDMIFSQLDGGTRHLWAIAGGATAVTVWRSDDHGASWAVSSTIPVPSGYYYESVALTSSFITPNRVFATVRSDTTTDVMSVFRSDDTVNWTNITGNLGYGSLTDFPGPPMAFVASTAGDGSIGGSGQDVLYGGAQFLGQSVGASGAWTGVGGCCDYHALAVDPWDRNTLLVGKDQGVYTLNYNPGVGSTTVTSMSQTLGVTELYTAAYSATNPNVILGGAQDVAFPFANGDLTVWRNVGGGDGLGAWINAANDQIQYTISNGPYFRRTTNRWAGYSDFAPPLSSGEYFIVPQLVGDPSRPSILYFGTQYLYRWDECGKSSSTGSCVGAWTGVHLGGQMLSGNGAPISAIAVAPNDPNRIYTGSADGQVWMSTDAGVSFTKIDSGAFAQQYIESISVNPTNEDDIVLGVFNEAISLGRGVLWQSTTQWHIWTQVTGVGSTQPLPSVPGIYSVAREPSSPSTTWYVGTDVGVFYTGDAGAHWYNATQPLGLPAVPVHQLTAVPGTGYLMAATWGRGIWRARLGCQPITCASGGYNCGTISDGCGQTLVCGTSCPSGQTCGGAGQPNVCGICVPMTCAGRCGVVPNGCGGNIDCGICPPPTCRTPVQCCLQNDCEWLRGRCICE
jgi:hypothetical protein